MNPIPGKSRGTALLERSRVITLLIKVVWLKSRTR
jgi:hypothetical protein